MTLRFHQNRTRTLDQHPARRLQQHTTILASGEIPGVLLPGESITVPVYYAGMQQPWDFVDSTVPMTLGVIQTSGTDPIDWSTFQSQLQPPDVSAAAWDRIYPNLTAQLGTTDGQYVATLDANAAYLGGLGENVTDIGKLLEFMYLQADNALGPVNQLASVVDASLPLPGGNAMSFSRDYDIPIASRDAVGILGYGWSADYQSKLSFNADGSIDLMLGVGGVSATFDPDTRNGGYFSPDQTLSLRRIPTALTPCSTKMAPSRTSAEWDAGLQTRHQWQPDHAGLQRQRPACGPAGFVRPVAQARLHSRSTSTRWPTTASSCAASTTSRAFAPTPTS